jgi:DNA polymerase III delta subunit
MMAAMAARAARPVELDASMRIVVLQGQDAFQITRRTEQLAEALTERFGDIQTFAYDGATAGAADLLDELRSYALLQTHKLVILDNAEQFLAREGHRHVMEHYAASPVDHATLLMRAPTWRPGKLDKLIEKVGSVIKITEPTRAKAVAWCIARCSKAHGGELAPAAAQRLVDLCGPELARLDTELAKLTTCAGPGRIIDGQLVATLVGLTREEEAWALQSAILTGDPRKAVHKLRELTRVSRIPETLLMWAVCDLLRKLHAATRMLQEGAAAAAIGHQLRLWGRTQQLVLSAARGLEPDSIAQLLHDAVVADALGKSGIGQSGRTLEALAIRMADTIGSS